jgi:hypothetical protein
MSGWDTPSRPTWDPQDGPDDGTQAFSIPDTSAGADHPWAAPQGSEWGAPDSGGRDSGGRDSGGRNTSGRNTGGSDFGAPASDDPFSGPPPEFFKQEFEQRTPGATLGRSVGMPSWDLPVRDGNGRARQGGPGVLGGLGGDEAVPQAPVWDEPQWQDAPRQELGRQDLTRQDFDRQDLTRQDLGRPDFDRQVPARQDLGRPDFDRQDLTRQNPVRQDLGRPEPARPEPARPDSAHQDPPRKNASRRKPGRTNRADYAPQPGRSRRADYAPRPDSTDYLPQPDATDYASQSGATDYAPQPGGGDYAAQPDHGDQAPSATARSEWESTAKMDPALQDFFAPAAPGSGYAQRPGQGPQGYRSHRDTQPPGLPGSNSHGGHGGHGTGQPSGGGRNRFVAVGAVVVVVIAVGAYLLLHKPNTSNAANAGTPTVSASTRASAAPTKAKATAKATAKAPHATSSANAADRYVLSTPSAAGGYPMGEDPHFLATTTTTATTIEQSAVSHSGGTVAGNPVSASYRLPDEQTIEFVGYQGTFNPKVVMANLGSFGSSEGTYSAGPHGGQMACANIPATMTTTSGAVCVWVTTSTLGVTEFFDISGPEALTTAQAKGASDTVALRSSVETHKS